MDEKHPLDNLTFSIDGEGVVRVGDLPCGNNTGSRASEHAHRQHTAAENAGTAEDMQLYHDLRNNDPDFQIIQNEMRELVESGHVQPEDAQEIANNPKRFIHEYVSLRDKMIADVQDRPRVDSILEDEDRLREERHQGGSSNRLRDLEIKMASRYIGGR